MSTQSGQLDRPTPETDALVPQFLSGGDIPDIFALCRKLERERDDLRAFLQQRIKGQARIAESNKFLMRELITSRKERDEAWQQEQIHYDNFAALQREAEPKKPTKAEESFLECFERNTQQVREERAASRKWTQK